MPSSHPPHRRTAASALTPPARSEDVSAENLVRPQRLRDFVGQQQVRAQLEVFIAAARQRHEPLDHVLLVSPPGLGKTTLATIIANEMKAGLRITNGPALEHAGDAAAALTSLKDGDVLFIDEIHRLHPAVEESMYPALEDGRFDVIAGDGAAGTTALSLTLTPFTLIGATTRAGMLTSPMRDRFGIVMRLIFYPPSDLALVLRRTAQILGTTLATDACHEIARRSRGTPRIANRLLRRVRDYAQVRADGIISKEVALAALELLEVDELGFDAVDKFYLEALVGTFNGGPAGLDTLAVAISESPETVEHYVEPYLIQQGYLQRTPRGRVAGPAAWRYTGQAPPTRTEQLFTANKEEPSS